jgi:hypothetical protein
MPESVTFIFDLVEEHFINLSCYPNVPRIPCQGGETVFHEALRRAF